MVAQVNTPAQQPEAQSVTSSRSIIITLCTLLLVGGLATTVYLRTPLQQEVPDIEDDKDSQTPTGILVRQLRMLGSKNGEEELALRTSLGNIYREEGRYAQAETQYSLAHDVAVKLGGSERLVNVLLSRGYARLQRGRLSAARKDLEMAYVLVDKETAVEQAVDVLRRLGDVQRDQGKLSEAIEVYEKATEMARKHLTGFALDSQVASLATETGEAYSRKGQSGEALDSLRVALNYLNEVHRNPMSTPIDSDPQEALTNALMGSVLHFRGDSSQAMDLYHKALRQQVRILRPDHSDLVFTRMGIARAHRDMGNSDKAMEALEAIEQTIRAGPQEGPDLARVLTFKADLLRETKSYTEATEAITEALKHQHKCFGRKGTPEIAVALNTYGSLLHDQKKYDDALRNYKHALELNMQTVGYENPETAATHNSIGTLFQDLGDDLAAQEHFEKCLDIQQKTVGAVSADVASTYNNLGTILYRRGELEDAAKLLEKALAVLDEVGASENLPDRAIYQENLDAVLKARAKTSQKAGGSETGVHV
eukprot:gnl/TRDRNA2_/TRDRNA2_175215_c0_seq12.p1 gnl/TRDRNA2_/TRDRNA2_175215_c0~~gnl/TRDRNA2_/TRDRNA2_175215_c0_seq12.p1  ORF type:complete len:538 (+),score=107.51 gnl/TRDRNA2_/TRDRNA2_175215_c0_seq12:122-1735(+)